MFDVFGLRARKLLESSDRLNQQLSNEIRSTSVLVRKQIDEISALTTMNERLRTCVRSQAQKFQQLHQELSSVRQASDLMSGQFKTLATALTMLGDTAKSAARGENPSWSLVFGDLDDSGAEEYARDPDSEKYSDRVLGSLDNIVNTEVAKNDPRKKSPAEIEREIEEMFDEEEGDDDDDDDFDEDEDFDDFYNDELESDEERRL